MKRQIWMRSMCIGMIGCLCMGLVTGCKNEPGSGEGAEETENMAQAVNENKDFSFQQFADIAYTQWKDEWKSAGADGEEVTFLVDAKVQIPHEDHMHIMELGGFAADAAYKEWIAERLFWDEEVYYNDLAHLPKEELEKAKEEFRQSGGRSLKDRREVIDGEEAYEKKLLKYEEALKTAEDTWTPVSTWDEDDYIGKREGVLYELSFWEADDRETEKKTGYTLGSVWYNPKDIYQVCPDEFAEVENLGLYGDNYLTSTENFCTFSQEEAEELAQQFVDGLELDYSECVGVRELCWLYDSMDPSREFEGRKNGYIFSWRGGIDASSYIQEAYGSFSKDSEKEKNLELEMEISLSDKGVVSAHLWQMVHTVGETEVVKFLPLDDVMEILKEQTMNNMEAFLFEDTSGIITFDNMHLFYYLVSDKVNPGHCSYVPVWKFSEGLQEKNAVWINAIDGSVMNFCDEE